MTFTSLYYLAFLPLLYVMFLLTKDSWRWLTLLVASFFFYASLQIPYLIVVLVYVVMVTYLGGIKIEDAVTQANKKSVFKLVVVLSLLPLLFLKYGFFIEKNISVLLGKRLIQTSVQQNTMLICIGVSYFVFQAISYLTDIYLEITKSERHAGYFALYMSYFPKLYQGPIERADDLLPQLRAPYVFNYDNVRSGLLLFIWGLFKKLVIADRLALFVDPVYGNIHSYSGLAFIIATYSYALQIYFDFSAYTDMAIGSARIFNINLTQNFNSPYLATSIGDFWRRWHISLSRWLLDYIFKPLQMEFRSGRHWGTAAALMITFSVSGAWHGAGWRFIVWGCLHGMYLATSVFYRSIQKKIHKTLNLEKTWMLKIWQIFFTFNLVALSWVFFRASGIRDALYIITHLFSKIDLSSGTITGQNFIRSQVLMGQDPIEFFIICCGLLVLVAVYIVNRKNDGINLFYTWPQLIRSMIYVGLPFITLLFGKYQNSSFIYFKF